MLRKTASTLWTRFVPAARQAYPAAASSMKRVRHRSRAIARVSARAMRLRFFSLALVGFFFIYSSPEVCRALWPLCVHSLVFTRTVV